MSKQLLYLMGEPGTGKITTARILQERLGWRLFWLHDLDAVCAIVGRYPLPRLMDKVSLAVLEAMMEEEQSIIYVRPSRDRETIDRVTALATANGYAPHLFQLWAEYSTMVKRVGQREQSSFRISSQEGLDTYLNARPSAPWWNTPTHLVSTEEKTPEQVADAILQILKKEQPDGREHANRQPANRGEAAAVSGGCA